MLARISEITPGARADRLSWTRTPSIDTSERARFETRLTAAIADQMAVQRLLADLAARFATVEAGGVGDALVDGLRQLAQHLRIDRAFLWEKAVWTHPTEVPRPELERLAATRFIASALEAHESTCFTRLDEVPDAGDREVFRRNGVRSAAVVPVTLSASAAGRCGALAFGSTMEREWEPATIEQLRLVAGIFSQALARQVTLNELHAARSTSSTSFARTP